MGRRKISTTYFFRHLNEFELDTEYKGNVITAINFISPLLHWMPRGIPEYTDHGLLHTTNVLRHLRNLIRTYDVNFTQEEKYLLALASVFHDLGCLVSRENHNEKTMNIMRKPPFTFFQSLLGPELFRCLTFIIQAHSKKFDLKDIPEDPSPDIKLKLLCILFRIADACDVNASRVKKILFDVLVDENLLCEKSKEIWSSHLEVENVHINGHVIELRYYEEGLAKLCIDDLSIDIELVNPHLTSLGLPIFVLDVKAAES